MEADVVAWSSKAIGSIIEFTKTRSPLEARTNLDWADQFRLFMKEKRRLRT